MDISSFWQRLLGWGRELKSILLAVGFVLIVRTVLAEPYHVPSPSMVPTLLTGDQLVAAKYAYGYSRYSSPIDLMPDFSGRLLGNDTLFFNAGRLDRSMELDTRDWLAVAKPRVAKIAA